MNWKTLHLSFPFLTGSWQTLLPFCRLIPPIFLLLLLPLSKWLVLHSLPLLLDQTFLVMCSHLDNPFCLLVFLSFISCWTCSMPFLPLLFHGLSRLYSLLFHAYLFLTCLLPQLCCVFGLIPEVLLCLKCPPLHFHPRILPGPVAIPFTPQNSLLVITE